MRVALAPINPTIADLSGNSALIVAAAERAFAERAELVVLPELALTGYPPRDLLLRADFIDAVEESVRELAARLPEIPVIIGAPARVDDSPEAALANSLLLLRGGRVEHRYDKKLLPAYDVFDEKRYFVPGDRSPVVEINGRRVGLAICEDLWRAADVPGARGYSDQPDPIEALIAEGVDLVVTSSASPFVLGKDERQQRILLEAATRLGRPVLSVNQLGANDELIFDGAIHAVFPSDASPHCLSRERFREEIGVIDTGAGEHPGWTAELEDDPDETLWHALTIALRDYARKTGFRAAVLGLSGGIDSALVAAIAAAALGAENVYAIAMPSRHSSSGSVADARDQAERTGLRLIEVPIEAMHRAAESSLAPAYDALCEEAGVANEPGIAEENVQSRLRGATVMAVSNKLNLLPLATGNKSEMAVGYCTLYGDMNGGVAPIADLYKTRVYGLARWINANHDRAGFASPPIPETVLAKAPSAELKPDQTDQDTLPSYEELDAVLEGLIDRRESIARVSARTGSAVELVERIALMTARAEYKRRQMPIGFKVTPQAFGIGRRVPVVKAREAARPEPVDSRLSP